MRIQHNIMAMNAYRNYTNNVSAMKSNLEKLSSGYKINRAGDDAAGLAISEKMRAQITGLETAQKNAKDGISLVQTAEGALTEVHDMLNRMVELATQSANGTYDVETDRAQMQKELNQLRSEIDRIADSSNFNGIKLLDGSMSDNTEITPITVANASAAAGNATTVFGTDTNSVIGNIAATGTTPGAASQTTLHSGDGTTTTGQFTLVFDQLKVNAGSDPAGLNITLKNATASGTLTLASLAATGASVNATAIASAINGKFMVVSANGTISFMNATATDAALGAKAGAGGLIYQAAKGSAAGTAKFTVYGYGNAAGTTTVQATDLSAVAASAISTKAQIDLNFDVTAAVTGTNATLQNNQNLGVKDVIKSEMAATPTFGNTKLDFDITKLKDGDLITIGAGSQAKTVAVQLKASNSLAKTGSVTVGSGTAAATVTVADVIDLSKYASANGTIAAANKLDAMNDVAAAFSSHAGIHVGVNQDGTALTLSEKTNAQGSSVANSAIQTAMSSLDSFKGLVQVNAASAQAGTAAQNTSTITVDPENVYEGNSVELTIGSNTTKYVFTADQKKLDATGSAVPAGTKYVSLKSSAGVVAELKNAIKGTVTGLASSAIAVDSTGKKITITASGSDIAKYKVADGSTDVKWTGNTGLKLQIGDTADTYNQLKVNIANMHVNALGIGDEDISIATQSAAQAAVDKIKAAINMVSDVRGTLGATQNRLDHTINNLSVMTENIQDAESTIRDTDVAEEMMAYTKNNILIQSAQAMLAQANQVPQGVLQLLQ